MKRPLSLRKHLGGDLIEESVEGVTVDTNDVKRVGETMTDIPASVDRVEEIFGLITSASIEQSRSIEAVNDALSQMSGVTQQNVQLVERAATSATALEAQARELVDGVSAFHL